MCPEFVIMKYLFHNFFNTLKHYKVSSLLNIIGMAVAFTAFYIILTQVSWNFNFNRNLENADRTYLLSITNDYSSEAYSPYLNRPVGNAIVTTSKEVEVGGVVNGMSWNDENYLYGKKGQETTKIPWKSGAEGTEGGFEAIGLKAVSGSMEKLREPGTLGVSESIAKEYGIEIGDVVAFDNTPEAMTAQIAMVFADMPRNTSFSGVSVIRHIGSNNEDNLSEWGFNFFMKLRNPEDKDSVLENAAAVMKKYYPEDNHKFALTSMEELFYAKDINYARNGRTGNRATDISLLIVAILTLLIALINFINFFFALVPVRIKSVNTYKVFGMSRKSLVVNFVMESLGIVLISLAMSAVLICLTAGSSFASALHSPCAFADNPGVAALTVLVALLSTAAGSIYPAMYITSFQPAIVLKGFSSATTGSNLRTMLIGVQFIVSIILIICTSFVKIQHRYMMNYDLGFDREQLLCGVFLGETSASAVSYYGPSNQAFENTLKADPRIKDITWSDGDIIATGRMGWGRNYKGEQIYFQCYPVSWNFLDFMGIEIVRGRDFQESDSRCEGGAIIFNEEADRRFGIDFDSPFNGHSDSYSEIAGICKDFHFKPLQYGNDAFAFYVFGKNPWRDRLSNFYVRTEAGANPFEVIQFIKDKVAELDPTFDMDLLSLSTFDKSLEKKYTEEKNMSMIMSLFTLIAIIISLMGVYGIVLFDAQHRSKEIAIRRVIGGEAGDILKMLNKKYVITVLVCFALASPLSYLIVDRYLSGFANRTPIFWWVFAATVIVVLLVTVMIVTVRSLGVATSNPVDHLKNE